MKFWEARHTSECS